jgi:hypothetical protein
VVFLQVVAYASISDAHAGVCREMHLFQSYLALCK